MITFNKITDFLTDDKPSMITAAVGCNIGNHREKNEDNFYFNGEILENSDNTGLDKILADTCYISGDEPGSWNFYGIFDGMGGGSYGELASAAAAKSVKNYLSDDEYINPYDITVSLDDMFQYSNREVVNTAEKLGASHMGSTMVSLFFYAELVWVSNIGDSPGFIYRNNDLIKITEDHTEKGITGRKPFLTQYLGMNPDEIRIKPTITCHNLLKDDRFLLCSDGLTDMVSKDVIKTILDQYPNDGKCVNALINNALENGGIDNITVMVFSIR